jgi:hypothetical protein
METFFTLVARTASNFIFCGRCADLISSTIFTEDPAMSIARDSEIYGSRVVDISKFLRELNAFIVSEQCSFR